jgi:hypothetical protein
LVIQAIAPVDIRFGWKRIQSLGQRLLPSTLTAGSSRPSADAHGRPLYGGSISTARFSCAEDPKNASAKSAAASAAYMLAD